jgi:hypothetical protein
MRNKILFSIAFSLILFTLACTDDSLGGGSSIDPNANPAIYANNSSSSNNKPGIKGGGSENTKVTKIDSISFTASEGSCNIEGALMKTVPKDDSIHLYMNKDGSAVLNEKMGTICPERGEITKISIEKQEDTLLVFIKYYEYPPDTVIVYNDSLGKNDTLVVHRPERLCMCYSDYEIEVPAEFTGAKFVGLKYTLNDVDGNVNTYLYPIAYKND